jgi:alkylated DNA repair dioxygenase AlkB
MAEYKPYTMHMFDKVVASPRLSHSYTSVDPDYEYMGHTGRPYKASPFPDIVNRVRAIVEEKVNGSDMATFRHVNTATNQTFADWLPADAASSSAVSSSSTPTSDINATSTTAANPPRNGSNSSGLWWDANFAVVNLYRDHNDSIAVHADNLTYHGRRPIVAGLSLGATRTFRLRRTPVKDDSQLTATAALVPGSATDNGNDTASDNGDTTTESHANAFGTLPVRAKRGALFAQRRQARTLDKKYIRYSIPLPHNSLIIMWPPCQEEWQHGMVPVILLITLSC